MVCMVTATTALACMAPATVVWYVGPATTALACVATALAAMVCMATAPAAMLAYLDGKVYIRGPFEKPGGSFKIDHPLDPANKYLYHSFVESPDMKNVYDGVVVLDDKGEAEIELPDWFGALNKDFRYQLTAIGAPGPNLYIAEEISDGCYKLQYT